MARIDAVLTELEGLMRNFSLDILDKFLIELDKNLNSFDFQLDLLQNSYSYLEIFSSLSGYLLTNCIAGYVKYEKLAILNLSHPSLIISNFFLCVLLELSEVLPLSRVNEITELVLNSCKVNESVNENYFRFLALSRNCDKTIENLQKERKFEIIGKIAIYLNENHELFQLAKQNLTLDCPCEIHLVIAKTAGNENVISCFKNFASKVWVTNSSQKRTQTEILALLEYSALPCIKLETNNLDILKSLIVSLTCANDYLDSFSSSSISLFCKNIISQISLYDIEEKYQKKIKELIQKIGLKAINELNKAQKTLEDIEEVRKLCQSLYKSRLEIMIPIIELQRILGLSTSITMDSGYDSVIQALEEITEHLKKVSYF